MPRIVRGGIARKKYDAGRPANHDRERRMQKWNFRLPILAALAMLIQNDSRGEELRPWIGTFLSRKPGVVDLGPSRRFEIKPIIRDLAEFGVSDVYFGHNQGRGGPFYHPTAVAHLKAHGVLGERDFLEELLAEADAHDVRVWLLWTPPSAGESRREQPGFKDGLYALDDYSLASPELRRVYCDLIDELAEKYLPRHPSLAGIYLHEIHAGLDPMNRPVDLERFKEYCRAEFGAAYAGTNMPGIDPDDVWSRRYLLYRNHVTTEFVRALADRARLRGLKTAFCHYPAETSSGWPIGADVLDLERVTDMMWEVSFALENCKHYYSIKGAMLDFGPTYRNNNPALNYASAFHGYPLSYFEFATPVYVDEIRAHFPPASPWHQQYGDPYTGHGGKTEREVELFFGKKNMGQWLRLMGRWQGGAPPAQISAAINPTPYLMLRPRGHSQFFVDNVAKLMECLTLWADVDGMISGSLAMPENLRRYETIIIPEEHGTGLREEVFRQYFKYVEEGGRLLVVNTPITTAAPDMTAARDRTAELCGVAWQPAAITALTFVAAADLAVTPPPPGRAWRHGALSNAAAEVLVKRADNGAPLLTRRRLGRGEVYFSALSFQPGLEDYFVSLAKLLAQPRFWLEGPGGMRILEAVQKDHQLCVSLWGQGGRVLKVDAARAGLTGAEFQVRDIVTGRIFAESLAAAALVNEGVSISITYSNQPMVVAVGAPEALRDYPGLYASAEVFRDLRERAPVAENPQVPILVPEGPGARIGVYHLGLGAEEIVKAAGAGGMRAFTLPRLDTEAMGYADVIVIPQIAGTVEFFNQARPVLRKFVENGGGILLTHDAVGYRAHQSVFPEVGVGLENVKDDRLQTAGRHPAAAGIAPGTAFNPGFRFDHVAIKPGPAGTGLVVNAQGAAVLAAGKFGRGRVVLLGTLPGVAGSPKSSDGRPAAPVGVELEIVRNALRWLAEKARAE